LCFGGADPFLFASAAFALALFFLLEGLPTGVTRDGLPFLPLPGRFDLRPSAERFGRACFGDGLGFLLRGVGSSFQSIGALVFEPSDFFGAGLGLRDFGL